MPTHEQLMEVWSAARLLVSSCGGRTAAEINNNATAKYPEYCKIPCERDFDEATERLWAVINAT